jgi:3',5'-cyclic AMP phosphodiesterase CpdA
VTNPPHIVVNVTDSLASYRDSASIVALPSIKIVHLSDMHFVTGPSMRFEGWWNGVNGHNCDTLPALQCEIPPLKPDILVATGDQTTFGDKHSLTEARDFLWDLGEKSGVPRDRIYCIPGNHDILLNYYRPFARGLRNYEKVFGSTQIASFHEIAGSKVAVFSFDSTLDREGQKSILWPVVGSRGRISASAFNSFNTEARSKQNADEYFKIALIHHHPLPIPFKASGGVGLELTTMTNGGTFIAHMQESGLNLILHGHEHYPYSCRYCYDPNGNDIVVVAAGTACQRGDKQNTFNYLEIVPGVSVTIRRYVYNEAGFHIDRGTTKTFRLIES